mmetsp:Transcript_19123/g.34605  ORF Transcript_19123/g.34605 Transcript_19123/m.34605 type:complete len:509 (-) Transcript_19123:223-1749(-)|eukprot:CAMPEP_0175064694 /NCGR_PEP_ID=MMETSP0052_2-20121109/15484_1 /TAXON_ID=51329 ORGANISM="Polytomella parva, Strain SAG 63-3" /NCGR_SAMPLE_ID=MMETSP0052_2 /ASSEMBLY_ACC=CAM_ASM_000194 /LENGTH=508 /DNA_ID=CAMNT_0016331091 /DNA_START=29 /DNA_END=1555 /DNA_ORIENTATION=-
MPAEVRGTSAGSAKNTGGLTGDNLGHKSVLDKQRSAISKIRAQNEQLKNELLLENKFSVRPGDPFAQALINKLQDEGDSLARKLVLEMRKIKMLEQQQQELNGTLTLSRTAMGGIFNAKEQSQAVLKRIKLLENRLEKAYVKFNQSQTHNKQLREQINNLRRERIMFESIHANLERELLKLRKDMAELIQMANATFEAKEKSLAEMNTVKIQAEKEQQGYEEEWKHLTAIIEEDKKDRERARAQELAMRERETQELLKMGMLSSDKKKKLARGTWGANYNKVMAQNVAAEKVEMYGQAFKKIQEATKIEDIDQLVNTFIAAEDQNFTLFNYVNEVNQEIEKLEDQILTIKSEINAYKQTGKEIDRVKTSQVKDIENRINTSETQAVLYKKRYEAATVTVTALKAGIQDLFERIGCNTPAVRDLLGEDGVNDGNIMSYLGIIEQRTNELLQAYARRKANEGNEGLSQALLAQPLTTPGKRIVIDPPSSSAEDDSEGQLGTYVLGITTLN